MQKRKGSQQRENWLLQVLNNSACDFNSYGIVWCDLLFLFEKTRWEQERLILSEA
jgi:hypothetical protein